MAHLSIRLLGRLQIDLDGTPVSGFESDKVRALLVFLAVDRIRVHRRETLAALLWPDYSDRSARTNLRRALSNLRKALGDRDAAHPFLLVTRQTIQFNGESDAWVDAAALVDRLGGPWQGASSSYDVPAGPKSAGRLEDAVELYGGEFLQGFSLADCPEFDDWVLLQGEQIHRRVMDALRFLSSWYEAQGEWEQALQHAWRQVELDPWRESGHQQLMRLLARSGQRSAALAQYQVCCQELAAALGVEPEEETVQLYEQIRDNKLELLDARPDAAWEPQLPPKLPAFVQSRQEHEDPAVFVAREPELARLDRLLEKAVRGQGQIVFVVGGPGRGKTALLSAFARRAMDTYSDLLFVSGRCNAYAGVGDPYLPFQDVLSMLTGDVEAQWKAGTITSDHALRLWNASPLAVQALLRHGSQVIPALLSGTALLSRATAAVPAGTAWLHKLETVVEQQGGPVPRSEQNRLFQQVANVLHVLAERHPLLIVLDDLQWIDANSASLLFHLGRQLPESRILIAGAYRPEEVVPGCSLTSSGQSAAGSRERHPLEKVLGEFKRWFGDIWLDLTAVTESGSREFVDAFLDAHPNHLGECFREALFQHTGGHPLFMAEILQAMQERGELGQDDAGAWVEEADLDWGMLPARVEGVIEERVSRLDDDLREILMVASVEGEEFTVDVVAKVLDVDPRELLPKISGVLAKCHRLVREQGVQVIGPHHLLRYRFSNALVQQYLYDQLSQGERMLLHSQISEILESLYSASQREASRGSEATWPTPVPQLWPSGDPAPNSPRNQRERYVSAAKGRGTWIAC